MTYGLTVMANAHRIASESLELALCLIKNPSLLSRAPAGTWDREFATHWNQVAGKQSGSLGPRSEITAGYFRMTLLFPSQHRCEKLCGQSMYLYTPRTTCH